MLVILEKPVASYWWMQLIVPDGHAWASQQMHSLNQWHSDVDQQQRQSPLLNWNSYIFPLMIAYRCYSTLSLSPNKLVGMFPMILAGLDYFSFTFLLSLKQAPSVMCNASSVREVGESPGSNDFFLKKRKEEFNLNFNLTSLILECNTQLSWLPIPPPLSTDLWNNWSFKTISNSKTAT